MCFIFHDWSKWGEPVDTATHFYKAQFRYCQKCNKIAVTYLSEHHHGNSANVSAKTIKEALPK